MSILLLLVTVVISAAIAKILFTEQPGRGLTGMPIVEGTIRYVLPILIVVVFFFPIYWILITTMKPQERYLVPGMTMGASRSAARPARVFAGALGKPVGPFHIAGADLALALRSGPPDPIEAPPRDAGGQGTAGIPHDAASSGPGRGRARRPARRMPRPATD